LNTIVDLFGQHNKTLATLCSVLIVILMSLSLANSVLFSIEHFDAIEFNPAGSVEQNTKANEQNINLANLNLFGKTEQQTTVAVVTDAPTTSLNLELKGVFSAEDAAESTAIVAQKGKTGELYHIGDRLPGNAILNAVLEDHILIKRGARIEKLPFADTPVSQLLNAATDQPGNQSARRTSPTRSQSSSSRLQQVRERIARRSQGNSQRNNSGARRNRDPNLRNRLNTYQQRLDSDPQTVLDELGVTAVSESGAKGYRLGSEVSEVMLRQAGLRQGDVVLSIDGKPIGNIANDKGLIAQAMKAKSVRVEIQRDDRRFIVSVPLPQ